MTDMNAVATSQCNTTTYIDRLVLLHHFSRLYWRSR